MNSISVYHCCKNTEYCTAQKIYVGGNITVFHGQTWPTKFLHYENFECIPDLLCPTWKYHIMHMQCAPCVFELAKSIQNQSSVCMQSCHFTATFNWRQLLCGIPEILVHMIVSDAWVYTVLCTDLHFCSTDRFPVYRYWKRSVLRKWRSGYETRVYSEMLRYPDPSQTCYLAINFTDAVFASDFYTLTKNWYLWRTHSKPVQLDDYIII